MTVAHGPHCQNCGALLRQTLINLGMSPLANSYVAPEDAAHADPFYPLHVRVCHQCWLVQVDNVVPATEIFGHYAYFSSFSETWLTHARHYAHLMIDRFDLDRDTEVIEIASNDGYLLQYFVEQGIPVLGIEPAQNVADAACAKSVPTLVAFFGESLAADLQAKGHKPRLIASKNVLAHVPDINDFVAGVARLLTGDAVYTVEFPHLLNLIAEVQFDTIYHEHFAYLSLLTVTKIFSKHGLRVFDVMEIPTHGGSLRVFACRDDADHATTDNVEAIRRKERGAHLDDRRGYEGFDAKVGTIKDDLLSFLHRAKDRGAKTAGYGAAAKGNTLLNYCHIGPDLVGYVVDRNPAKQNTFLPGSRIPVFPVDKLIADAPDYVLILPWNIRDEVIGQLKELRDRGCQFVTAIPKLTVTP